MKKVDLRVLSLSFIYKLKNWTPCKSSKWESKLLLCVDDAAIFLIDIRKDLIRHLCFFLNWKSISSFDKSCCKYFGPRPVRSWPLRQWCNTARCCVSFIRCGLFTSEVFIWNNYLKVFPRFCAAKQKPAYSYSWISLFISIIWLS